MVYIGKYAERGQTASSVCPGPKGWFAAIAAACLILSLSSAAALEAPTQPFADSSAGDPGGAPRLGSYMLDDAQRARVARLVDEISDLDASELDAAAQQKVGVDEADLVLAVLLRAGRPTPPGLSTARRAQRDVRSNEALAWLRAALAEPSRAALVSDAVSSALNVASPAPELSVAAMRVVAQLDLVEHTAEVAQWLDSAADETERERMRLCAQSVLLKLYGRWFADEDAFRNQWELLRGRSPEVSGRDELLKARLSANAYALTIIEFAPQRLGQGPLDWPSDQMRTEAARAIGRAVAADTMVPDVARQTLVDGLEEERSADALAARLQTLLDLVQGADPSGEAVQEVRTLVFRLAELAQSRSCDEIWVMIGALSRLGHPYGIEGDAGRGETVSLAVELFRRALGRGEVMALDPDALQSAMTAISSVIRSIQDDEYGAEIARPYAELVRPMVVGERGAARRAAMPLRVRRAAADAFALSVKPSDAQDLVALVQKMDRPELEYELLGALRAVISVLEPGSPEAETVIHRLFETVADPKFDSRSRALELLLSEDVRPALLSVQRSMESQRVETRLLDEPAPELQVRLATLLGLVGDIDSLERLMTPPAGQDASSAPLAVLANTGDELTTAAAELARSLSASSPSARIRAALSIAGPETSLTEPVGEPATLATSLATSLATRARRPIHMRAGLDLMLAVDFASDAFPGISASERDAALAWIFPAALELRRAQPIPMSTLFSGSSAEALALRSLIELEAKTAADAAPDGTSDPTPRAAELVKALMTSDQMRAAAGLGLQSADPGAEAAELNEVISAFSEVIDDVSVRGPFHGWTRTNLLVEGVDLLLALDETEGAIRRLERLLDSLEPAPGVDPKPAAPSIIRLYATLVLSADPSRGQAESRASRAALHLTELVQRSTWTTEPPDARLLDLERALQVSTMLRGDDPRGPALKAAIKKAASEPAARRDLATVDADRAAAVLGQLGVEDGSE